MAEEGAGSLCCAGGHFNVLLYVIAGMGGVKVGKEVRRAEVGHGKVGGKKGDVNRNQVDGINTTPSSSRTSKSDTSQYKWMDDPKHHNHPETDHALHYHLIIKKPHHNPPTHLQILTQHKRETRSTTQK